VDTKPEAHGAFLPFRTSQLCGARPTYHAPCAAVAAAADAWPPLRRQVDALLAGAEAGGRGDLCTWRAPSNPLTA